MTSDDDKGRTAWNEGDSAAFLDYGRYFVPERELQIDTICSLIPPVTGPVHLADLCCGEGLLSAALLERFPQAQVHGFDGSPAMLERAAAALASHGDRFSTRLFDLAATDWRRLPWRLHAAVSSLAIHHLDGPAKQALFRDVAAALVAGGAFVVADLVKPATSLGSQVAARAWDETVRQRSLSLNGDLGAFECFRQLNWNYYADPSPDPADKPSLLLEQLKWLEDAGFHDIDVFWMKAGHAVFGGYKRS